MVMIAGYINGFNTYDNLTQDPYQLGYRIDDDETAAPVFIDDNITCPYSTDKLANVVVQLQCDDNVPHYCDYTSFIHQANDRTRCIQCRQFITPEKVTILMKEAVAPSSSSQKEEDEKSIAPLQNRYRPLKPEFVLRADVQHALDSSFQRKSFAVLNALDWANYGMLEATWCTLEIIGSVAAYCFVALHCSYMCLMSPIYFPFVMATDDLEGQRERFTAAFESSRMTLMGVAALVIGGAVGFITTGALILTFTLPLVPVITIVASTVLIGLGLFSAPDNPPRFTPRQIWNNDIPRTIEIDSFCSYRDEESRRICATILNLNTIAREMTEEERLALSIAERGLYGIGFNGDVDALVPTRDMNRQVFNNSIVWHFPQIP